MSHALLVERFLSRVARYGNGVLLQIGLSAKESKLTCGLRKTCAKDFRKKLKCLVIADLREGQPSGENLER